MAAAKQSTAIELPPLNIQTIDIPIIGDSPLICHAWSKKAKEEMLAKHMKKAGKGRPAKDPWRDFCETLYWLDGMPAEPGEEDIINGRFQHNANVLSAEQVIGLFEAGGFGVGIGDWRPERDGVHGRFHVARTGESMPCR